MTHNQPRRRVVYLTSRRAHKEIMEMLRHQHDLLHRILKGQDKLMTQAEDLTREMQETKDAVGVVAVRMQELIDQLANQPALTAAAQAAIDGLNEIQTQLASMGSTPPADPNA